MSKSALKAIDLKIAAICELNDVTIDNFKHPEHQQLIVVSIRVLDMFYMLMRQLDKQLPVSESSWISNWVMVCLTPKLFGFVCLYRNALICSNVRCTAHNPNCVNVVQWGILRTRYADCVTHVLRLMSMVETIENGAYINQVQEHFNRFAEELCNFRVDSSIHD